ncbi:aminoglycoside phosphotransferase family protein [Cytobacillus sp. FJAT-53684]|uniref:Aminoglycoside phosphotransferase family protein n=1 Tax=Cytobacillus mangrovibacter TaxID=3299024 RepID=A0ABW6JZT2_9BACI
MLESEMLDFVKSNLSNTTVNEIEVNNKGWDNHIMIINKAIVFRFPKSRALLTKVVDEVKLLECLSLKEPIVKIPKYELVYNGNKPKAVKYPLIKGKSLSEHAIYDLSANPENAKIIGDFLTKLHSIDLSELEGTKLDTVHTLNYWQGLYSSVKTVVFPYLNQHQQEEVNEIFADFIRDFPSLTYKKTVIHGDLTSSNMIFNKEDGLVTGIIDFTDAQIGDPAFDFAGLYWNFGPAFTREVLSWYSASESVDTLFSRVSSFYGLQPIFHELIYAIENNHRIHVDRAFEKITNLRMGRTVL